MESSRNIWRNSLMSIASVSSVASALLVLGVVFILIININSITQGAKEQYDTIQVYLADGLSEAETQGIGKQLSALSGVADIRYETKDEALEKMQSSWANNSYLLDGLEENPMPNSYVLTLQSLNTAGFVAEAAGKMTGVEDVKYYRDVIERMLKISELIRNTGLVIIFLLLFLSTFIINNTVKLAVTARRREINIMKFVGATNWFVRWPFIVEGTLLGLFGGLIALGVVMLLYQYVYGMVTDQFYALIAAYIVSTKIVLRDLSLIFIVVGSGIGALGSILSMRKHLNV